jgi:hypothetical protein
MSVLWIFSFGDISNSLYMKQQFPVTKFFMTILWMVVTQFRILQEFSNVVGNPLGEQHTRRPLQTLSVVCRFEGL